MRYQIWVLFLLLQALLPIPAMAQGRVAPVKVFKSIRRLEAAGQVFIGTTRPVKRTTVGSAVDGRVVSIEIEEGDPVTFAAKKTKKGPLGQVLVKLRTKTIHYQLRASKAQLKLREQERDELITGSLPEEKIQAKAKWESAKSNVALADAHLKRMENLYRNSRTTTLDMVQRAKAQAKTARQAVVEAKAAYDLVEKGPRKERIEQAKARFAAQQAEVERLTDQLARYTIRAPFTGYVTLKHTEVGAWVSKGDPIVDVIALDPIEVDVAVPERYISYLRRGVKTQVRLDALPNHVFTGTVYRIVPQAREQSRTFPVRIRIQNPRQKDGSHVIKAGMLAHATLSVGRKSPVTLVHKDALVLGGRRPQVFVVGNDGKVVRHEVDLGIAVDSLYEIRGRIRPGQRVVVRGNEGLVPGQAVKIVGEIGPNSDLSVPRK